LTMTTRTLTDHKVNGLNEALEIHVLDQPGPGGANHKYAIHLTQMPADSPVDRLLNPALCTLSFQNGPINEAGINGISGEALLAVVIDRMRGFQYANNVAGERTTAPGQYACRENAIALTHMEESLMWLQKRTRDRMARGVEGTMKK
jgi:hypothetical protein